MTNEEFIKLFNTVMNDIVQSKKKTLENPSESSKDIQFSKWYGSLSEEEKEYVNRVMKSSAESVLWKWLCILDEVSFLEDIGEKGRFDLYFSKNGEKSLINNPEGEELHAIYSADYIHNKH